MKDENLLVDIGAKNREDACKYVQEGVSIHPNIDHQELLNGYTSGHGIDDRGGVFMQY